MYSSEKNLSVLIIEDNPGDFILIEKYIKDEAPGADVQHAKTFTAAQHIVSSGFVFDVFLLDLTLPDTSRETLITNALQLAGNSALIVLTGYPDKSFSIKTLALGVSDYLLKESLNGPHLHKSIVYSIERKRINTILKASEEKYRNLFDSSPIPTWVYDPDTYLFLNVNDAACRNYGYSKTEFLAMTIMDIRPPQDVKKVEDFIQQNKNTHSGNGVFRHYKKNGELIYVNIKSNTILFSDKEARLVVSSDITEKIKADVEIREINDRYDLVSKATRDAIWDYSFISKKTYIAGAGYKHMFGYDIVDDYAPNQFWEERLHPEDKPAVLQKLSDFIADTSQAQGQYEYRFLKADGTYAYVSNRFFIIRKKGVPLRLIGALNDISKKKEEEQRLRLLESIIINSNDAVMITEANPLSEPGPKILYVNESFIKMTGFAREEIIGMTPRMFQGPQTSRAELDKVRKSLEKNEACNVEVINYSKNGLTYWVGMNISPVPDHTGHVSHYISIERDITRRKIEELEREKLIFELMQNNKDLRQFSYITSHNLRGPIANLLGLTNLLDNYKLEDTTLKKILDGIKKSATRFDETIHDLTMVLNVKDRPSIPKEEIAISGVYEKVLLQCQTYLDESNAVLHVDFENAPVLYANKAYLESILMNLLTNALKYRNPLHQLKVTIRTEKTEDGIALEFSDNGLGFDVNLHKDKVFGLYQRFHTHTEGKGIGLFLIKSQMDALKGFIEVESKVGEGTLFRLKFATHPEETA